MSTDRRGWLSGLVTAVKRYYGFPTAPRRFSATLEVVQGDAVIALPATRCPSDDWTADLLTVELPACVVDRPQRTAVREAVTDRRERYWQETPLFMAVVEALGMNDLLGAVA